MAEDFSPESFEMPALDLGSEPTTVGEDTKVYTANRLAALKSDPTTSTDALIESAAQIQRSLNLLGEQDIKEIVRYETDYAVSEAEDRILRSMATSKLRIAATFGDSEESRARTEEIDRAAVDSLKSILTPVDIPEEDHLARALAGKLAGMDSIANQKILRDDHMEMLAAQVSDPGKTIIDDFGGLFVPLRTTASEIKFPGDYFDTVRWFHSLPVDEQIKNARSVQAMVAKAAGGNAILARSLFDPFIDEYKADELKIDLAIDQLGWFDIGSMALAFKGLRKIRKIGGLAKFYGSAGDKRKAGDLAAAAALSEEESVASKVAGLSKEDAINTASPFEHEGRKLGGALKGMAAETQAAIAGRVDSVRKRMQSVLDTDINMGIAGPINDPKSIELANARITEQYAGSAKIVRQLNNGVELEVVVENPAFKKPVPDLEALDTSLREQRAVIRKMQEEMGEDFDLSLKAQEEVKKLAKIEEKIRKAEKLVEEQRLGPTLTQRNIVRYTTDDMGTLNVDQVSRSSTTLNSPEVWVNQFHDNIVQEATSLNFQKSVFSREFFKAARESVTGLNKQQRVTLSEALLRGDREERVFTARELVGMGLRTNDEIAAYYAQRAILDELHRMKDQMIRRGLEFNKYQRMALDVGGVRMDVFAKPDAALKSIPADVHRLYDGATKSVIDAGSIRDFAKRIEKGEVVVKFNKGVSFGDETINYALVKPNKLRPIGTKPVLNYRKGYLPLIRSNVFYVVRQEDLPRLVDGVKVNNWKRTVRFFDSKDEANSWAAAEEVRTGIKHRAHYSRELAETEPDYRQSIEEEYFGGTFSGTRKEGRIPFGLDGLNEAERISGPEAIERYMNHIANAMPVSEWRMGVIQKFLNSNRQHLSDPNDWLSPLKLPTVDPRKKDIEAYRTWIETQLHLAGTQDRVWGDATRAIAEMMDGTQNSKLAKYTGLDALRLRLLRTSANPQLTARVRSLTNHLYLGVLSFAQVPVQLMNMSLVASMNIPGTAVAIPKYMALRLAMYAKNDPEVWKVAAKTAEINPTKFNKMMAAFHKSGVLDSVSTNADIEAARAGLSATAAGWERLKSGSMFLYRESELAARSFAWIVAHDEFMAKKAADYVLTDFDIREINRGMLRYTLNMDRANAARWQRGLLSIPTQYMQVSAKFVENLLPVAFGGTTNWTPIQKARVFAGSVLLFGSQGIPLGQWMPQLVADATNDSENPEKMSDLGRAAFNGGLTEAMFQMITGTTPDFASRTSLAAGVGQIFTGFSERFTGERGDVKDIFMGAFGGLYTRFTDAMDIMAPLLITATERDHPPEVWRRAFIEVASMASSVSNMHKAMLWHEYQMKTAKDGTPIMPLDDDAGENEIIFQALGLAPLELRQYYDLIKKEKQTSKVLTEKADIMERIVRKYADSGLQYDKDYRESVDAMVSWVVSGMNDEDRLKLQQRVNQRLSQKNWALVETLLKVQDQSGINEGTYGEEGNKFLDPNYEIPKME